MWFAESYRGAVWGSHGWVNQDAGGPEVVDGALVPERGLCGLHGCETPRFCTSVAGQAVRCWGGQGRLWRRVVRSLRRELSWACSASGPRATSTEVVVQCGTEGRSRSEVAHARAAIRWIVTEKEEMDPATRFGLRVAEAPWICWWRQSRFAIPGITCCSAALRLQALLPGCLLTDFQNHTPSQLVETIEPYMNSLSPWSAPGDPVCRADSLRPRICSLHRRVWQSIERRLTLSACTPPPLRRLSLANCCPVARPQSFHVQNPSGPFTVRIRGT